MAEKTAMGSALFGYTERQPRRNGNVFALTAAFAEGAAEGTIGLLNFIFPA